MDFKKIDAKYRPAPFWSWNEKLDTEETKRQIEVMHASGIGGFFMHARGGLKTEYMSDEWFENIEAGIEKAEELGMYPWAYDENGWPSGFGDGKVNGLGEHFQQKWLRYDNEADGENTICIIDGVRYYYEVNPFYIDVLLADATKVFLEEIYTPYYEKYKNRIKGFFTDEPQISRDGIPWSDTLCEEYKNAYHDDLLLHLPEIFENKGDYKTTRIRFYKLITDLFSKNFMKQIYDWCTERGLSLTGHLVQEETFQIQTTSSGAVMPHYEYFTIPGMDCLGRSIIYDLTSYQLGSACQQLGKKQVMSESFAGCGFGVGLDDLKKIYEHQMVHGANLLCQHLEGYSLRGLRKRDWPPAMFYQQPWWDVYKTFCDMVARTGKILAEGTPCPDTLLIHPMTTAWTFYNENGNEGLEEFYQEFKNTVNDFDKKHIQFHLGDETLIERHGRVEGDKFIVGEMSYKRVVLPENLILFDNTKKLIDEFVKGGGVLITPDEVAAENEIIDNENVIYTKCIYDDFEIYYFLNHTEEPQNARISVAGKRIDATTGEVVPFAENYTFAPGESAIVLYDGKKEEVKKTPEKTIDLSGEWKIESTTPNILTLDFCEYYFDGELQEKKGYVLNILHRAMKLKRPVEIRQIFRVDVKDIPKELYFVCETPENFTISVNGTVIDNTKNSGYIIDKSFVKLDIAEYIIKGENKIELLCNFVQSERVYKDLEEAYVFETMKNKLTYDMEIEPCYLAGDFGVEVAGEWKPLERSAYRTGNEFTIVKKPEIITLSNIQKQGFPFFAGAISVSKEFDLCDTDYKLAFSKCGINGIKINVNGNDAGNLLWHPFERDISHLLKPGKNKITLTLYNTLRNMQGPHHLKEGESYFVMPSMFYKEKCVWSQNPEAEWCEDYCFVENSINN